VQVLGSEIIPDDFKKIEQKLILSAEPWLPMINARFALA
jgi:hypothetical protein